MSILIVVEGNAARFRRHSHFGHINLTRFVDYDRNLRLFDETIRVVCDVLWSISDQHRFIVTFFMFMEITRMAFVKITHHNQHLGQPLWASRNNWHRCKHSGWKQTLTASFMAHNKILQSARNTSKQQTFSECAFPFTTSCMKVKTCTRWVCRVLKFSHALKSNFVCFLFSWWVKLLNFHQTRFLCFTALPLQPKRQSYLDVRRVNHQMDCNFSIFIIVIGKSRRMSVCQSSSCLFWFIF